MSARLPHALRSRRRRRRRHLDQVRGLLTAAQWNWDMYNDSPTEPLDRDGCVEVARRSGFGRAHGAPTRAAIAEARRRLEDWPPVRIGPGGAP